MNRIMGLALICAAAACADGPKDAEARYEIVLRHGSPAERCTAAREVAGAYLKAKNEKEFRWWNLKADVQCLGVELQNL